MASDRKNSRSRGKIAGIWSRVYVRDQVAGIRLTDYFSDSACFRAMRMLALSASVSSSSSVRMLRKYQTPTNIPDTHRTGCPRTVGKTWVSQIFFTRRNLMCGRESSASPFPHWLKNAPAREPQAFPVPLPLRDPIWNHLYRRRSSSQPSSKIWDAEEVRRFQVLP